MFYVLVPIDSGGGVVHIRKADECIEKPSRSKLSRKEISNLADPE